MPKSYNGHNYKALDFSYVFYYAELLEISSVEYENSTVEINNKVTNLHLAINNSYK